MTGVFRRRRDRMMTRCAGLKTGAVIAARPCPTRDGQWGGRGEVAGKWDRETPVPAGDPQVGRGEEVTGFDG